MMASYLRQRILGCLFAGMVILIHEPLGESCPMFPCTAPGCTRNCSCISWTKITCYNTGITVLTRLFIESFPNTTSALYLDKNRIEIIKKGTFKGLESLGRLYLENNNIETIEDGAFAELANLWGLDLDNNRLKVIPKKALQGLGNVEYLYLGGNEIEVIEDEVFKDLIKLTKLDLSRNRLKEIKKGTFRTQTRLDTLFLEGNELTEFVEGMFQGIKYMFFLFLDRNRLTEIRRQTFDGLKYLTYLYIIENEISVIHRGAFQNLTRLETLLLDKNNITVVKQGSFDGIRRLYFLELSSNKITHIEEKAFKDLTRLLYLGLSRNNIIGLNPVTLGGLQRIIFLNLGWNPIHDINNQTFNATPSLALVNMMGSNLDIIPAIHPWTPRNTTLQFLPSGKYFSVTLYDYGGLQNFMRKAGFICKYRGEGIPSIFSPLECRMCPTGSFIYSYRCLACPPGGFYQDVMGLYYEKVTSYNMGCKECPPGRYVSPDAAPGKDITECASCPQGTQYYGVAKFRACFCLETFYRLDRFGPCFECPSDGLTCQNESVDLKPGYYWKWESQVTLHLYKNFTKGLQVQNNYYDKNNMKFSKSFPRVYACPMASSCLGGMEASCSEGYEGPLCAVCSEGYYQMISTCQKCPSLKWLIGQIILAVLLLSLIMLPLIFGKRMRGGSGRSVTDIVLARFKIFIGFYQVTSGTLDAFFYIEWPELLLQLGTYAKFLQLNLMQIAPVNCFSNSVTVTTYTSFLLSLAFTTAVVIASVTYYHVRKLYLRKTKLSNDEELRAAISETKETCLRYAFLVMFVVYPMMSAQIFQILPPSCQKICVDVQEKYCQSYLRSDYHLECFTDSHNKFAIIAFSLLSFVVGFPLITLFLLRIYHHNGDQTNNNENAIGAGISFLYENYSENCWFWEVVELVRKIILTSVLVLIGGESRTNLGVAAIMSGLYAVLFASYQPISDRFEHWLQLVSLLATSANMNAGMLLKIPQENMSSGETSEFESTGITVLLVSVNLMVTGMIAVRYFVAFLSVIQALRQRPQCSLECCLSVSMMMNDAAEDVVMFKNDDDEEQNSKDHVTGDHPGD